MKFELRNIEDSDIHDLVHHANNRKIARYMTNRFAYPYTKDAGRDFIRFCKDNNGSYIKAIAIDGKMVGAIGLHLQTDIMKNNAELAYWVGEEYWNQGIVSNAIKEYVAWGFSNFPITRIYARPFGSNKASQRVLEKTGFTLEARIVGNIEKWGELEDELIYSIRVEAT